MSQPTELSVGGAPEGFDARLVLSEIDKTGRPVIHVARDDKRMAAMADALRFFAPGMPVVSFPSWDCLPYDRMSPNPNVSAARMAALAALVHGMPGRFVLLTTINAATQKVPARAVLKDAAFRARVGQGSTRRLREISCFRMGFPQAPRWAEARVITRARGIIESNPRRDRRGAARSFGDVLERRAALRCGDPADDREAGPGGRLAAGQRGILDEGAITRSGSPIGWSSERRDDDRSTRSVSGGASTGVEHWLGFCMTGWRRFSITCRAPGQLDDHAAPIPDTRWKLIDEDLRDAGWRWRGKSRHDTVLQARDRRVAGILDERGHWKQPLGEGLVLQVSSRALSQSRLWSIERGRAHRRNLRGRSGSIEKISLSEPWRISSREAQDGPVVVALIRGRAGGAVGADRGRGVSGERIAVRGYLTRVGKNGGYHHCCLCFGNLGSQGRRLDRPAVSRSFPEQTAGSTGWVEDEAS